MATVTCDLIICIVQPSCEVRSPTPTGLESIK